MILGDYLQNGSRCYRTIVCPICLSVCKVSVLCGQTVGRIKMPLGAEVGLDPGDIALDGDPAPPTERGTTAPDTFRPTALWHGRPSQKLLISCDA